MTNREIGLIETSELMKLSKEELKKMVDKAKEEFKKIDATVEQYGIKPESWDIAFRRQKVLETILEEKIYSQYDFPLNPTCGSHELGPLPRVGGIGIAY